MKHTVIGFSFSRGISSKTGGPYSMKQVYVLSPVKNVSSEKRTVDQQGFTMVQIDMTDEVFDKFQGANLVFPLVLDLVTDTEFRGQNAVPVIKDFIVVK